MNRRTFLKSTAATSLVLGQTGLLHALEADNPYLATLGLQLYTLRRELEKDTPGTLKQVAAAGYKQVELYGFPDSDAMVKGAKDAGLAIHSSHFNWDAAVNPKDEAMSDFERILERARATGLTDLVVPYLLPPNRTTLDDWKKTTANLNRAAGLAKKAGIRLAYHNHNFEFAPHEGGRTGYDILTEEGAADLHFEIDVFWVKAAGLDPVTLMRKLAGRVTQLHLKDLKIGFPIPSFDTGIAADSFKELGAGMIEFEPILIAARETGVRYCHVEQDQSPDALASIRTSIQFLGKL